MGGDRRRPWTLAIPEESPVRCGLLGGNGIFDIDKNELMRSELPELSLTGRNVITEAVTSEVVIMLQ
ncbi:hypothetical protein EVAR_18617_1 [Eumeta japonica]|uniref:Uncharacterized protein n=1 Tax=Eumeta variegata TaxID=151549 RepID=A0A4C1V448_EUMVA|nr:hypothetical protein EVAR_18617_1 [Eumeta japonica]